MSYHLTKNRVYKFTDFLAIPLQVSPVCTTTIILNHILSALMPALQVMITAEFIDTALAIFNGSAIRGDIYQPLVFLMLIVAYHSLNWQLMSYVNLKFEMKLTKVYRSLIAEKRAKLEYCHIEDNSTWDLINRTCQDVVGRLTSGLNNLLGAFGIVIRVFSLLLILMTQVWWAGIIIVLISVPLFALAIYGGKETYKANVEADKYSRRASYLQSVLQARDNVEERTLFGYTESVNQRWLEKYETSRKINMKVRLKYYIRMKGSSLITVFLSLAITGVLLVPLSQGTITVGMFMSLVTGTLNLIQMMSWNLSYTMSELAKNREYLKDLTMFFGLSETEGALSLPQEKDSVAFDSIEFENVSFKYPGTEKYVLKDFSLRLDKNLHYAFVGTNGAGKTTVTKLLTGMYNNYEGKILINKKELRQYTQAELKTFFAVVYQDFAKYYISLKDNISLGNVLELNDAAINRVASVIGLNSTIGDLHSGIDTPLGKIKENGVDLSGGQWQKVAIARALYNPAQIRILDEPTAALDPVAESSIYEMFGKISKGKSTIFITHRLGAAKLADEIIVIDEGKVREQGSHKELLELNGIYAEMFNAQRSWYK
ncbi:MAG: ABC transporter ATP-binding protein [Firmicutes bacterium]|nr:ABC transporter ATP-binding protein [Bacillota bacterium]MDD4264429.1 ABC transporter ATP-binding protein [Bacillota bacterium]MDD4694141.1 ABC transporter ATP-binding protein [Bacillota bacterium]